MSQIGVIIFYIRFTFFEKMGYFNETQLQKTNNRAKFMALLSVRSCAHSATPDYQDDGGHI